MTSHEESQKQLKQMRRSIQSGLALVLLLTVSQYAGSQERHSPRTEARPDEAQGSLGGGHRSSPPGVITDEIVGAINDGGDGPRNPGPGRPPGTPPGRPGGPGGFLPGRPDHPERPPGGMRPEDPRAEHPGFPRGPGPRDPGRPERPDRPDRPERPIRPGPDYPDRPIYPEPREPRRPYPPYPERPVRPRPIPRPGYPVNPRPIEGHYEEAVIYINDVLQNERIDLDNRMRLAERFPGGILVAVDVDTYSSDSFSQMTLIVDGRISETLYSPVGNLRLRIPNGVDIGYYGHRIDLAVSGRIQVGAIRALVYVDNYYP